MVLIHSTPTTAKQHSYEATTKQAIPPSTPDLLVRHKVKECCVELHASIQRWKQLCHKGFDIASKLANTLLIQKYTQSCSGGLLSEHAVTTSLEAKVIKEREDLYVKLKDVQKDLVTTVDKIGALTSSVKTAIELIIVQGHPLDQPVFQTLPPSKFDFYFKEVYKSYSQELSLREDIVRDILKQTDRDTVTMYLSCWLHEPYIGSGCNESLEALLVDTGLR